MPSCINRLAHERYKCTFRQTMWPLIWGLLICGFGAVISTYCSETTLANAGFEEANIDVGGAAEQGFGSMVLGATGKLFANMNVEASNGYFMAAFGGSGFFLGATVTLVTRWLVNSNGQDGYSISSINWLMFYMVLGGAAFALIGYFTAADGHKMKSIGQFLGWGLMGSAILRMIVVGLSGLCGCSPKASPATPQVQLEPEKSPHTVSPSPTYIAPPSDDPVPIQGEGRRTADSEAPPDYNLGEIAPITKLQPVNGFGFDRPNDFDSRRRLRSVEQRLKRAGLIPQ